MPLKRQTRTLLTILAQQLQLGHAKLDLEAELTLLHFARQNGASRHDKAVCDLCYAGVSPTAIAAVYRSAEEHA